MVLSPKGKILAINIINPIDEHIDLQIIQSIRSTAGNWEKRDTDDTVKLYFQFRFRIITENFNHQNYTFIANDRFLLPVFITTINFENDFIKITPDNSLAKFSDRAIKDKNYAEAALYLDEFFVVDKDGFVTDVNVMRGIGYGCDEEAVRLIKSMPRWKPGLQHGEPVKIKYNLPVRFFLD